MTHWLAATGAAACLVAGAALAAGEHGSMGMDHGQAMDHGHGMEHGAMDATGAAADTRRAMATEQGRFFLAYTPVPDPIPVNRLFRLRLDVYRSAAREQRVSDARISVDAGMPQHGHGMNTAPVVTPTADGGYLVEGMKFHMPGTAGAPWEVTVRVEAGGNSDSARFHVVNGQ